MHKENSSLELLTPVPQERLLSWLAEFYGKPVHIGHTELLRHRDLSYVERLFIEDGLPKSIIYKLVLPPWDIEQELLQRVLIPSISNSAQLYLCAHYGATTALFLEDLGSQSLLTQSNPALAVKVGEELAKMHRAYSYRTEELLELGVLRSMLPLDYEQFASTLTAYLLSESLISRSDGENLCRLARLLAAKLANEPKSLVHGDFFAENIILKGERLFIIDWSWFTQLGVPLMDLATITMNHIKNEGFAAWGNEVIDAYCFESARDVLSVKILLPYAESLHKLLFLYWLVERRRRGIKGTTIGGVDEVIPNVVRELCAVQKQFSAT